MSNGLSYLEQITKEIRGAYARTLPEAPMPEKLLDSEKAQSAILEARHALHEAMCHIGTASLIMHKEGEGES